LKNRIRFFKLVDYIGKQDERVIEMDGKKKFGAAAGALLFLALAVALCVIWQASRPGTASGEKHITVEVVHKNGDDVEFSYDTNEGYLGAVLVNEGLISGSEGAYGLYVETVDGETADYSVDGGWWKLSCNGEDSQLGVDSVPVNDGDRYTWTYTTG